MQSASMRRSVAPEASSAWSPDARARSGSHRHQLAARALDPDWSR
jgi:hypothetical protein